VGGSDFLEAVVGVGVEELEVIRGLYNRFVDRSPLRSRRSRRILVSPHFFQVRHSALRSATVKTIPAKLHTLAAYVVACKPFFVSAFSAHFAVIPRRTRDCLPLNAYT
jgi:hypothetical protein